MSVDFVSVVALLRPAAARRLVARIEGAEHLGDLVDETGGTVHDFSSRGEVISLRTCRRAMRARAAAPEDFESAYVEGLPDADLGPRSTMIFSSNFPLVSVLDRVVAIPHGVPLLLGRGYRRLRPIARARTEAAWLGLVEKLGGERKVARRVAPYVDRGGGALDDAHLALRAIRRGLGRARELERDLVILGCLASQTL